MTDQEILKLNEQGLLAGVLGFETTEVAKSAQGTDIRTYAGAEYIDFTGGIAVHALGHGHAEVVAAIREQAGLVTHTSDIMRHAPQLELAAWMRERLANAAPKSSPWTFLFLNGGSESTDAAAKLAIKATGRTHFVAFEGGFHGRTLFATALSQSKKLHWEAYEGYFAPLRAQIHHAPAPHCRVPSGCCRPSEHLICCDASCMDGLEELLRRVGDKVAAIFFEPQQGEGGYVPMPAPAAQRMRALADRYGILLVADEVQTGWGRTGRWLGFEHLGIAPDIVVFGKAIGGGLPLAGIAAPGDIMALWETGEHGTTFGGNPVACTAGLAAMRVIEREGLVANAERVGAYIRDRFERQSRRLNLYDVRGWGLMIGIELRDEKGQPSWARCAAVKKAAHDNGLLIMSAGARIGKPYLDNATLRIIPPLNVPEDVVAHALEILEKSLTAA